MVSAASAAIDAALLGAGVMLWAMSGPNPARDVWHAVRLASIALARPRRVPCATGRETETTMNATNSPIPFDSLPAAGFEQPFEMLSACHDRVQRMLRLLQRLRVHLATMGCDGQAQQAARDVMRYFDRAAPAHHEDEERHVFPPLLAAGACVETVQRLQREHVEMALLWPQVRSVLQRVADGAWQGFEPDDEGTLEQYARLYDWHVAAENELVYPAAAARLGPAAQQAMGEEMSSRRDVRRSK